ncbi:MAG: 6-phosphogluconolactonase [Nitrosomonas sp.]|nr:6-phosphogluconolactonase [Nitrosomonas sp.]
MSNSRLAERHAFSDLSLLSEALAQSVAVTLRNAIERYGKASLVVPGGHTPVVYLTRLAQKDNTRQQLLNNLSDETLVEPTTAQSK